MIHKSRYPDIQIPDCSVTELVIGADKSSLALTAVVDGGTGRSITYAELRADIDRFRSYLQGRGLRLGDVVAIMSPNTLWYPAVFHGVLSAGGVVSPVNTQYTAAEVSRQLKDSGARFAVATPALAGVIRAADCDVEPIVIDESAVSPAPNYTDSVEQSIPPFRPDRLAVLPYSSGTTGISKGVRLSHLNLTANVMQLDSLLGLDEGPNRESVLAVLPFFHIYGMNVILNHGLYRNARIVTMARFDLLKMLALIQRYKITRLYAAPPIILSLAKDPRIDDFDLSSLRIVVSGSAPLGAGLADACESRLGLGVRVIQGFGMTELSPVSHVTPRADSEPPGASPVPKESVGYALPNTECRLVDHVTGQDVAVGVTGELWIRGPQVMQGYHLNKTATDATVDSEGWLHTGDIAVVDAEGRFTIVDRLKELIKYKGHQIAPAELEAVLVAHPAIDDAAVIGVADREAGEIPRAYVVVRGGTSLTAGDVIEWVAAAVAPYKRVREVVVVDAIPRSASGKILRRQLPDVRAASNPPERN
jgi:acyl-CoA synthetase (AMP-forming)/AMP-acid ligase II